MITNEVLLRVMLRANASLWAPHLRHAFECFEINTQWRVAAFLAQAAHESFELNRIIENMNYSAKRLIVVWPQRFPTLESAQRYERKPELLANYVYANRLGNGNEASGDGWRYRGRGIFQLTGRDNYRIAGSRLGLPLEDKPEMVETPEIAALTAGWYWDYRGLNKLADCESDDTFVSICKLVNGGLIGLKDRKAYWENAKRFLVFGMFCVCGCEGDS